MAKFNEIEIREKLRAEFEIDTNIINIKEYCAWLEDKEVQRRIDHQKAIESIKKHKDV